MNYQHQQLAGGGWQKLSLAEQLANVGSEVARAIIWKNKNNPAYSQEALVRALELLDLTIAGQNNYFRLKELTRLREALVDYFYFDNQYSSSDSLWQKYFYCFNYQARCH